MNFQKIVLVLFLAVTPIVLFWGCGSSKNPVAPSSTAGISVEVPMRDANGQLLGATNNTFYYCLTGGSLPVTGSVGPVAASNISSTYTFNINTSGAQGATLISLEVADASSTLSLAVGASPISIGGALPVTVGPMNKSAYEVNALSSGNYYEFTTNVVSATSISNADVTCGTDGSGFQLGSANSTNTVAYLGTGVMASYLTVPATSRFGTSSSASKAAVLGGNASSNPVAVNDVYCVKLASGGYAWLQITSAGIYPGTGPSFNFRINTTLNYCAYQQSTADLSSVLVFTLANATPAYGLAISGPSSGSATILYSNEMNSTNSWVQGFNLSPTPSPVATMAVTTSSYVGGGLAVAGGGTTIIKSYTQQNFVFGYQVNPPTTPVTIGAYNTLATSFFNSYFSSNASSGTWIYPYGVASDSNSTVYGTDGVGSGACTYQVMGFSAGSYTGGPIAAFYNSSVPVPFAGLSCTPYDLAVTVSGGVTYVYVADSENNRVSLYTSNSSTAFATGTNWTTDKISGGNTFSNPAGIALNGQGRLVVANGSSTSSFSIVEWNISNPTSPSYLGEWGPAIANYGVLSFNSTGCIGLAIDNATPPNIYALDYNNAKIVSFKGL